jgi:hypothetical protein
MKKKKEYLYIISCISGQKVVLEKLYAFSSGIYYTIMKSIETNVVKHQYFSDPETFILWHGRLGHIGSIMMRQIIKNSHGDPLKNLNILLRCENPCVACS